jgi:agmatinase
MKRYEANVPSVGLVSFLRSPICEDFAKIDADVAVLGIPYDAGIGFRPGTRFGPRDIRNYSVRYSGWGGWKTSGYWDVNDGKRKLTSTRIVDCGDVDVAYYDIERNMRLMTDNVAAILDRGAMPLVLGGDHSVSYPVVRAFERFAPLDIVHIDAHLDWIDHVDGIKFANGSPFRRMSELPFVRQMVHLGIRDLRSREGDFADAIKFGSQIFTRQQIRERGTQGVLDAMPTMNNIYMSIDIDGLDPSIAPGTGSPTVDGLLYHEVRALLQGVARKGKVVGFDVVEVNPMVDLHGQTSLLTTTMIVEFLGAIFGEPR